MFKKFVMLYTISSLSLLALADDNDFSAFSDKAKNIITSMYSIDMRPKQKTYNQIAKEAKQERKNSINTLKSNERKELIEYIKNNTEKIIPIYFIKLADDIYQTDKKEAVFFYTFGRLRSMEDLAQCADKSAVRQVYIYPMLAQNTVKYISEINGDEYADIVEKALLWDENHPQRPNAVWSCYSGNLAPFADTTPALKSKDEILTEHNEIKQAFREHAAESRKKQAK